MQEEVDSWGQKRFLLDSVDCVYFIIFITWYYDDLYEVQRYYIISK